MAYFVIEKDAEGREYEVRRRFPSGYELCLQYGHLVYDDDTLGDSSYRFIYRRPPHGHLLPVLGQSQIPSLEVVRELMQMASDRGWGEFG